MNKNEFLRKPIDSMAMDRKATIKKYSDSLTFNIYQEKNKTLKVQISPNSTVGQLISEVKQRLGPNSKDYIGLMTRDANQIIDYTLKVKNLSLSSFPNNMNLQIQRKEDVQNENQPSLSDFQFLKLLGSGVSASVYLVRHKGNGKLYALKQINKNYFKDFKRMEQVLRQRKIMIELITDIPFTSRLMASFQSQKFLNLVLQYYPGGQMFLHLQRRRLSEDQAKLYVAQMVIAFQKLHEKKIIYRDLKPENIMIDFEGHARLGDYGLCKINLEYYDLTYSYCGSQQYMAPQVRSENGYNYSVDFYTLGSFAYELVNGVPPYYNNQPIYFQEDATPQFSQIITRLIQANMHKRLKSFNQIKRLKWFKGIQWRKILEKKYQMPFKLDIEQNYIGQQFKGANIDPQIYDETKFDKLLEFFFYLSPDKGGISQFYGKKKEYLKKSINDSSTKKKRLSIEGSNNQNSRKSEKSKSSHRSSKSGLKEKTGNVFRKKIGPAVNIYTSQHMGKDKSSKKLFNSGNSSNQKSMKKASTSQNKSSNYNSISAKVVKKVQKAQQHSQKITMKKVKSSGGLLTSSNTYRKVIELQNVFSPMKMKSPKRMRPLMDI